MQTENAQQPDSSADFFVYEMNDWIWYVARSLEEAKRFCVVDSGCDEKDVENAREVSPEEMDRLQFYDDIYAGEDSTKRSFREELDRRIARHRGLTGPEVFATTEY